MEDGTLVIRALIIAQKVSFRNMIYHFTISKNFMRVGWTTHGIDLSFCEDNADNTFQPKAPCCEREYKHKQSYINQISWFKST